MGTNWASWSLIALGGLMILAEVVLGAATGFDFALVGLSLAAGGGLGLLFNSAMAALFSAGALSFVYMAFLRSRIRSKLMAPGLPSNVDALLGSRGIVTIEITPDAAGQVKIGPELWRAVLSSAVRLVSTAAESYFHDRAEMMRRLEVLSTVLEKNTKYILPANADLVTVLGFDNAAAPPVLPLKAAGTVGKSGGATSTLPMPR